MRRGEANLQQVAILRERVLYWQPTGPSPPHRLDVLVDRPCAMGVLNSLFYVALYLPSYVYCVRETEILVEQQPPQGDSVCDHAGRVVNEFSLCM